MKKLVLETTAPFQGLPELVAYDEGLFAKEGLEIALGYVAQMNASSHWDLHMGVKTRLIQTELKAAITAYQPRTACPGPAACPLDLPPGQHSMRNKSRDV